MAGKVRKQANTAVLRRLVELNSNVLDVRPIIAVTMRESGCTYTEIAEVFSFTRQMAETMVNKAKTKIAE